MAAPGISRRNVLRAFALGAAGGLAGCPSRRDATPGEPRVSPSASAAADDAASRGAGSELWAPARTWVFAVGILGFAASNEYASFPTKDRRDAELMALFQSRGVPAAQLLFLKDEVATRAKITASLAEFLRRPAPGDTVIVYYAGHGTGDDDGETYFIPYDAGDSLAKTAWSVRSIFDAVDASFRGARAWLVADCCCSGALSVEARAREARAGATKKVALATLSSSLASELSTGNWTFTECLLAALRGDPRLDLDQDGRVTLDELARFTEAEMAFAEGQLSTFATANGFPASLVLAPTRGDGARKQKPSRAFERVLVASKGATYPALIEEVREGSPEPFKVHYFGYDRATDEWIGEDRIRPYSPAEYARGSKVLVKWKAKWYPAVVIDGKLGLHRIHYDGFSRVWDEWVPAARIKKPTK